MGLLSANCPKTLLNLGDGFKGKPMVAANLTLDKNRKIAIALAFLGAFQPTPLPLAFLHKLYLRQYLWSGVYLLLGLTQIARVACLCEGLWYCFGANHERFANPLTFKGGALSALIPTGEVDPSAQVEAMATALRELERLRQEGLLSESEFEQKRRGLLDKLT
jgi:TM2 domain-containing membrane protein YozV